MKCIPARLLRDPSPKSLREQVPELTDKINRGMLRGSVTPEQIEEILEKSGAFDLDDIRGRWLLSPSEALKRMAAAAKASARLGLLVGSLARR